MGLATVSASKILLFGGCQNDQGAALGDLIMFDANTEVYTEIHPTSESPSARYDMGFAKAGNGKVYLVGGKPSLWTTGDSEVEIL